MAGGKSVPPIGESSFGGFTNWVVSFKAKWGVLAFPTIYLRHAQLEILKESIRSTSQRLFSPCWPILPHSPSHTHSGCLPCTCSSWWRIPGPLTTCFPTNQRSYPITPSQVDECAWAILPLRRLLGTAPQLFHSTGRRFSFAAVSMSLPFGTHYNVYARTSTSVGCANKM